ncbi:MAG: hypothetical protein ACKV2Q_23330 [Planctomycetaceae bacterium]
MKLGNSIGHDDIGGMLSHNRLLKKSVAALAGVRDARGPMFEARVLANGGYVGVIRLFGGFAEASLAA